MRPRRFVVGAAIWFLVTAFVAGTADAATSTPEWAPAGNATIHPGVEVNSASGQCTSNFVFFDATDIYMGQAAHCTGTGGATDTNGCLAQSLPLGTPVQIDGASKPGTLVYNSWLTMQTEKEKDAGTCQGNDFALVRLDPADRARVNPSIPFWGGPSGVDQTAAFGETVYGYGNSSLRLGLTALSPKIGLSTGPSNGDWTHNVYTITPGIPGDSGSAYMGSAGGALGVLSTISTNASNQVSDLGRALTYMKAKTDFDAVQLADGTEAFQPLF